MRTPSTVARIMAVGAVAAVGTIVPLGIAGAATYPAGGTPPEVSPNQISKPTNPANLANPASTVVAGKTAARSTLPFTGTDAVQLSAIAGASVGIGLVMVRRSRRHASA